MSGKLIQRILAVTALILATLAAITGSPFEKSNYPDWDIKNINIDGEETTIISVTELAKWIIEKKNDFLIIDLRSEEKYKKYHIPFSYNSSVHAFWYFFSFPLFFVVVLQFPL